MARADLLKMVFCQKRKNCVIGGECPFLFEYRHILFCVSEILGQGCQIEKLSLLSDGNGQSESGISPPAEKLVIGPRLPGFG
jgi:hypothetical protein